MLLCHCYITKTMSNAMMSITIYKHNGFWSFTDDERGLVHEPFVSGIPEIIDFFIEKYGDKDSGTHTILFSGRKFPGSQGCLFKTKNDYEPDHGGAWYEYDARFPIPSETYWETGEVTPSSPTEELFQSVPMKGWLCPATLAFFKKFPEQIHVAFDLASSGKKILAIV